MNCSRIDFQPSFVVIATFCINEEVKDRAIDAGVTVLQRKGDLIETTAA